MKLLKRRALNVIEFETVKACKSRKIKNRLYNKITYEYTT